jgi:hypothetical protein
MLGTINTDSIERFWSTCRRGVAGLLSKQGLAGLRPKHGLAGLLPTRGSARTGVSSTRSKPASSAQAWMTPEERHWWVLEEPRWFFAILTFGFLALVEVLSWAMSGWPLCMVASTYQASPSCASFSEGVGRFLTFVWGHTNSGAVTATAAILIALFTWSLWRANERMWSVTTAAADAARRSADALVVAEQAQLFAVFGVSNIAHVLTELGARGPSSEEAPKERVFVQYALKNYGRTPAVLKEISHELQHWSRLPEELKYFPIPAMPKEVAVVAGASSESLQCTLAVPLTAEAATSIGRSDSYLWFYGRVVYEDAFAREREHRFLYRYRIGPGFQPYHYKDYNKST